jgi:hypothetical protein
MDSDGRHVFEETIAQKLFPNKALKGEIIEIRLNGHAKHQILGTKIVVTVFTDYGGHSREFEVDKLLKIRPAGQNWGDAQELTFDMFK